MSNTYAWKGIDINGTCVHGTQDAENIKELKNILTKKNIFPIKIHKNFTLLLGFKKPKITAKHITDFSRQLCTLINSGIPILNALTIIEQSCEQVSLRDIIKKVKADLESGNSLAISLQNKSEHFDSLFYNLISIGEESGTLDLILNHIANYKEKGEELKRKVKKALLYPSVIFLVALAVSAVLLIFVVPQFTELYQSFGAELPVYTQMIIKLAAVIKTNGIWFLCFIAITFLFFRFYHRNSLRFALIIDELLLKIPIFGSLIKKAIISRFTRMLAITFKSGLSLRQALQSMATIAENMVYQQAILKICEHVSAGQTITSAINDNYLFPKRMVQMIAIGEESGNLDNMLIKIAEYYESEVNYFVDNLNNLLEPMIMVILGVLIGGLIIAIYLPIFRLGTVI